MAKNGIPAPESGSSPFMATWFRWCVPIFLRMGILLLLFLLLGVQIVGGAYGQMFAYGAGVGFLAFKETNYLSCYVYITEHFHQAAGFMVWPDTSNLA